MVGVTRWSENKISELEAAGRGRGTGPNYKPWLDVFAVNSIGRCRRVGHSQKVGRTVELMSDIEYDMYLCLDWAPHIVDIREQFPLPRDLTREVARQLSIQHPCYPGTTVPCVLTVDFLATTQVETQETLVAYDCKDDSAAEDRRTMDKLELQRETMNMLGIAHHLVFGSQLPTAAVKNLKWINGCRQKSVEESPTPEYWSDCTFRLRSALTRCRDLTSLSDFCSKFDITQGWAPGTSLRAAGIMFYNRELVPSNLECPALQNESVASLRLVKATSHRSAVGGC